MEQIILEQPILLSTVLVPIAAAMASWALGDRVKEDVHAGLNGGALLYSLVIYLALAWRFGLDKIVRDPWVWDVPGLGRFSMIFDAMVFPVLVGIALVTGLVAIYSVPYMRHRFEEMEHEGVKAPGWGAYFMMYTMFAAAMLGTVMTTNTVEFYLFLELTLIPSFLLIAFYGYGDRVRIAILYMLWTQMGAVLFLIGALALGFNVGFDFYDPATGRFMLGFGDEGLAGGLATAVLAAMTIGLLVKMAVFGVHIWLPYAHAEAPTPISALLSPNLIGIGGVMLLRIVYTAFPSGFSSMAPILLFWAVATMIYGGFMALQQTDFKRLLAYSSVSQMGYMMLGLASISVYGFAGMILHYLVHAYGKAILFLTAGILITMLHGLRSIPRMGGLAAKMPVTAALALIGFMNITGIPPMPGLWSEYLLVRGAVEYVFSRGVLEFVALGGGLLLAIGLSTAYSFLTMKRIFYGSLPDHLKEARDAGGSLTLPLVALAAAGLLTFLFIYWMLDPLMAILSQVYG